MTSCDRDTSSGCRDAAVMIMLVRLGLRAGEVAKLKLDDLDWRAGEIFVRAREAASNTFPCRPMSAKPWRGPDGVCAHQGAPSCPHQHWCIANRGRRRSARRRIAIRGRAGPAASPRPDNGDLCQG
ncbi:MULTISPECIES: tyrosine-type recombinase/integrase [Rhizobium]|uniref:tyrosine-type recombinase/integrase n=1 Tax=Rhizobium TaxID=379 RepID=UPI001E3CD27C|nr:MULTISPECIES: tyrosine-type recombinase/integrase [Rhizobium]UFS85112.1 tyrosine-type recombinase/integrase [Rhizobium sp. T136]